MKHLVVHVPPSASKDELEVDLLTAKVDILSRMFHIIRDVQQDKSKTFVMSQLGSKSGLLLSDWAMKVLPQMYREKMDNWFEKKGISLHVDFCVFEHVIEQIKQNLPDLTALYTRSGNVDCYAGTATIISRQVICASADICLKRTDFSETQRGKNQADHDIAVAKFCLTVYTNRGDNLINTKSIKEAFDESVGNLSGCKTSVNAIDEFKCVLPKMKIEGITRDHSVAFNRETTGKKVTVKDAFQEMRRVQKSDNTKLFTTNQYLTKNQIRSILGHLSKKGSIDRRSQLMHNNEKDQKQDSYKEPTSSDEDGGENYFKKQQDEELEDLEPDEIDHALNCYSDNEYNTKKMNQS
ncbi:unnamed protein product [Rotaria sp. Silwood2]|nr:unnamed protein product [Rotaria sp. Silwood2]CAF3946780.1 unnamed protein product [Rotaria sp. Silwood2]CAF4262859.1 unnamed protein product [Rotaria sp. Silwood2]